MLSITFLLDCLDLFRRDATRPKATLGLLLKLRHLTHEMPFGMTAWTPAGISMMMGAAMLLKREDG